MVPSNSPLNGLPDNLVGSPTRLFGESIGLCGQRKKLSMLALTRNFTVHLRDQHCHLSAISNARLGYFITFEATGNSYGVG